MLVQMFYVCFLDQMVSKISNQGKSTESEFGEDMIIFLLHDCYCEVEMHSERCYNHDTSFASLLWKVQEVLTKYHCFYCATIRSTDLSFFA